jgi:hypothetical protein
LILQASKTTTSKPVGADERRLLLTLELFSLLDQQHVQESKEYYEKNNLLISSSSSPDHKKVSFSETVKWSVLSMMRSCSVCQKTHCSFHRQSLILPPFKLPRATSYNKRLQNPLSDIFVDEGVYKEPTMRFICDPCLEMAHVPRYEALKQEVAIIANRSRGFSSGTMYIDICDGASVIGRHSPIFPSKEQEEEILSKSRNAGGGNNINFSNAPKKDIVLDHFEPTIGISQVQNSLLLKNENDGDAHDQIYVTGLQVAGSSLSEDTVYKVLKNPDLKRLNISMGQAQNLSWSVLSDFVELYLERNGNMFSALDSIEELKVNGSTQSTSARVLPLHRFVNLKNLTLSSLQLTEADVLGMIYCMLQEEQQQSVTTTTKKLESSKKRIPPAGCRLLQNVILVNISNLNLDFVLDTFGQLPLNLLSCANMQVSASALAASETFYRNRILLDNKPESSSSNEKQGPQEGQIYYHDEDEVVDPDDERNEETRQNSSINMMGGKSPINVANLIMWGSNATVGWMSQNLLPRALYLVSIDVSSLSILITQFLDACAAANLSLLRVVRANNCNFAEGPNRAISGGSAIPVGSEAFMDTGFFFYQDGVRRKVTTWENLVSLSTIQFLKLRVISTNFIANSTNNKRNSLLNQQHHVSPRDVAELSKLSTLPSLTSVTVSFLNDVAEVTFCHPAVLGQLNVLTNLTFHSTGNSNTLPRSLTQFELEKTGSISTDGENSEKLVLPNLQKLHLYNHPPFGFAFSGAPNLRQLIIAGYQHKERLRDFLERGAGRNVEELSFCRDPTQSGASQIDIPLGACSKLKSLSLQHSYYCTAGTIDALSSCKSTIKKLVISDLGKHMTISINEGKLENALNGMNLLEELDLSDTEQGLEFNGMIPSSTNFLILPSLKKFYKREMVEPGYVHTWNAAFKNKMLAGTAVDSRLPNGEDDDDESDNSLRKNGILRWLSFQPALEEIDLEGSLVLASDFSAFWKSPAMVNKVKYLNIAHTKYVSSSNVVEGYLKSAVADSSKIPSPQALKVLVWNHHWHGENAQKLLSSIPHLKALEIFNLFPSSSSSTVVDADKHVWPESWTRKMSDTKGVQMTSGEGYSILITRK